MGASTFTYISIIRRWVKMYFSLMPLSNPLGDFAFLCPEQSTLFWKVCFNGECRIIAYHLNDNAVSDVITNYDVNEIPGVQPADFIRRMTFGPGCNGQIMACELTMVEDDVRLFSPPCICVMATGVWSNTLASTSLCILILATSYPWPVYVMMVSGSASCFSFGTRMT